MIELLKNQYISYLNSRKPHLSPFDGSSLIVRAENVSDEYFDIQDKKATIKQPLGMGSATYHNPGLKDITIIDYEDLLNQLPFDLQKGVERCDFVVYDETEDSFFILNELSQSSSSKNKISDARRQLHKAAFYFSEIADINNFVNRRSRRICVFSNKHKLVPTPDDMAKAFSEIQAYLPDPIRHNFQPITKLGYELIETAIVEV